MSKAALRFLRALAEPGAFARSDGLDGATVVLHRIRGGITLGAGRVPRAVVDELVGLDLCDVRPSTGGRPVYAVSTAGRACLRRAAALPEEQFSAQHGELTTRSITTEEGAVPVRLRVAESPLDWLRSRRDRNGSPLIDAASYEAGERLRRDLTAAQMLPAVTLDWSRAATGEGRNGPRDPGAASDHALAARQRVRRALEAVGPDFAGLLVDLCGFLKGLEIIERERDWPPRSAKVIVGLALGRLAAHYGLEQEAHGPERARGVRSWRQPPETARPDAEG